VIRRGVAIDAGSPSTTDQRFRGCSGVTGNGQTIGVLQHAPVEERMERTIRIPDGLYTRLEASALRRGLKDIRRLLEEWEAEEEEQLRRHEAVRQVNEVREYLYDKYGEMPDSTDLIRGDRER
jgi:hypothetical protein